jgi:P-type Cu2+ transporter
VPLRDLANFPGLGIEARAQGRRVRIGAQAFCQELCGGAPPVAPPGAGATPVYLAEESGWLALFLLEDEVRPEAAAVVSALASRGLRLHIASGDEPAAVRAVAEALGIARFRGAMKPRDKADFVERLQREGRVVAMVGDGLNDAPVLARADVSFAMAGGTDLAQQQADVVLGASRLAAIVDVLAGAERAMRLIRQNLGWAAAYNVIALPLAAIGWIGPWGAAIGMGASSLIVLANAMRPLSGDSIWKASTSSSPSRSLSYS